MKYGNYIYDPKKKRWINQITGQTALLGNRLKTKEGDYIQLNSNGTVTKVGSVSRGLSKEYIALKKKLGQAVDIKAEDTAMRQGLIKDRQTGKWRLDTEDKRKTKVIDGRQYYLSNVGNSKGTWTNFDTGLDLSTDKAKIEKAIQQNIKKKLDKKKDESISEKIGKLGIISGLVDAGLDKIGVENELARAGIQMASNFAYSIPLVGTTLSLADVGILAANGRYGDAAAAIGFGLLPGGKSLKTFKQLKEASKLRKLLPKRLGIDSRSIIDRRGSTSLRDLRTKYQTLSPQDYLGKRLGKLVAGDKNIKLSSKQIKNFNRIKNSLKVGGIGAGLGQYIYETQQDFNKAQQEAYNDQIKLQQRLNEQDQISGLWLGRLDNNNITDTLNRESGSNKFTPEVAQYMKDQLAYKNITLKDLFNQ